MNGGIIKKLNKNRTAVLITAALIVIAFVIGGVRPLGKLRAEGAAVFSGGVEQIGGRNIEINIMADLRDYHGKANNAAVIAGRHFDGGINVMTGLQSARTALNAEINEKNLEADRLYKAYDGLRRAVKELELYMAQNNADSAEFRDVISELDSLNVIITRQSAVFNNAASAFNERLGRFPAVIFELTGLVKPLHLFYN
ncbi:MAG: hypothetical protein FWE91_04585 [Defluviitaleaceae bacterium]|nr:hypothetical protein [Defluviitaleaceae bacterium]MCL2836975.1 hypothetical protein [Defluviitaleaceae bacterium]